MGIQKRPCKGKWGFYIGNLEGMRVNREIYLLFHFDEIENIRIEEKFKGDSLKIHLPLYIFRIYEYRRNFLIPVNLDRSRENSLRFIFLFFFFSLIFFATTSINVVRDVVSRRKDRRVIVYLDK